jgi:hypothetical protein
LARMASRRESSAAAFNGARRSTARSRARATCQDVIGSRDAQRRWLGHQVITGSQHGRGMGQGRRRAAARTQYGGAAVGGVAARSVCPSRGCGTRGDGGLGVGVGAEALGPAVAAVLRRSCPVGRWGGLAWPRARHRARARAGRVQIRVALFKRDFLQFFQLKWSKI